jgi:dihydroorotate dehydrogenase electron transfer subunit
MTAHAADHAAPPRSRFDATVASNDPLCREHYRLRLRVSAAQAFPATRPGQFVQLGCRTPNGAMDMQALLGGEHAWSPGQRPQLHQPELCGRLALLRRPFSLAGRGDDEHGAWLDIIHRVVGVGTDWLSRLQVGDAVDLIGPLGNWFDLPAGKARGLLVGGGVGLPPMFYLAQALQHAGWEAVGFVGAMSRDLLAVTFDPAEPPDAQGQPRMSALEFARCGFPAVITTDDGSLGLQGRITRGLEMQLAQFSDEQAARTVVFTCGPEPMMHAVAKLAAMHDVDCQVCMEQAMACGMGTCQSCVIRVKSTGAPGRDWVYRLACTDGTIFPAEQLLW